MNTQHLTQWSLSPEGSYAVLEAGATVNLGSWFGEAVNRVKAGELAIPIADYAQISDSFLRSYRRVGRCDCSVGISLCPCDTRLSGIKDHASRSRPSSLVILLVRARALATRPHPSHEVSLE